MTHVSSGALLPRLRDAVRSDRLGVAVALLALAVFAFLYNPLVISGDDAASFYGFLQLVFGDHPARSIFDPHHVAVGYYFGLAYLNAPFYALGKLLGALGVDRIGRATPEAALVALAGSVYMLAAAGVTAQLLKRLQLRHRGGAVFASVAGTPLLYYGVYQSGKTHAAETFLVAVALLLLALLYRTPQRWLPISAAVGVVLGWATATRYSIAGGIAGLLIALLAYRRLGQAFVIGAASLASFAALYILPRAVGAPIFAGNASTATSMTLGFAPLTPLRLLFSGDRGAFLWTPVMAIGLLGYVRLLLTRRNDRPLLVQIGAFSLGLFCFFFFVTLWWAGWSFSSRYLTPLFPAVAIGIAEVLQWRPRLSTPLVAALAAWTVYLAINLSLGIGPYVERGTAWRTAALPARHHMTLKLYLYELYGSSRLAGLLRR